MSEAESLLEQHKSSAEQGTHALPCMQIGSPGQTQHDSSPALEVKPFIFPQA